jgi:hypothetical protein
MLRPANRLLKNLPSLPLARASLPAGESGEEVYFHISLPGKRSLVPREKVRMRIFLQAAKDR